jgi:hypothetical protein
VSEQDTLLLTETGVERLPDGSLAVNVGPIVRALKFLTEGAGEDRGTDEQGNPLPDLMSLAFEVIESIIVGGRKAEVFRQLKRELDERNAGSRSAVALATQARRVVPTAQATALDQAADALQVLLAELRGLSLAEEAARELSQALEAFRSFGADRWVSATAQLLVAAKALGVTPDAEPPRRPSRKRKQAPKRKRGAPVPLEKDRTPKRAGKPEPKRAGKPEPKRAGKPEPKRAGKPEPKPAKRAKKPKRKSR